jgi:hypothetical protein
MLYLFFNVGSDVPRVNLAPCHGMWEINLKCDIIYVHIYMNLKQNLISRFCLATLIFTYARKLECNVVSSSCPC